MKKSWKNCLTDADINDIILSALNEALRLGEVWRGSEVVITRRSWKPFVRKGAWVRIPPSPLKTQLIEYLIMNQANYGEVPKLAEGAPLERE